MDFRFPMDRYLRALASLARDNPQSSAYFFNCYIVLWIFSAIFRLLSSVLHCDMEILRNLPLTFPTVTWHNLRNLSLTFSSVICVVEILRNLPQSFLSVTFRCGDSQQSSRCLSQMLHYIYCGDSV